MMRGAILLGLAMSGLLVPTAALADGSDTSTIRLRATVPASCWVKPEMGAILRADANGSTTARVVEACNSGGFRVIANYRPLEPGERATLQYGDRSVPLPASGEALLRQSNRAEIREREFRFQETTLQAPLVIALAIAPL